MTHKEDLQNRLKNLILTQCNTSGCDDCGYKYSMDGSGECSATDLEGRS